METSRTSDSPHVSNVSLLFTTAAAAHANRFLAQCPSQAKTLVAPRSVNARTMDLGLMPALARQKRLVSAPNAKYLHAIHWPQSRASSPSRLKERLERTYHTVSSSSSDAAAWTRMRPDLHPQRQCGLPTPGGCAVRCRSEYM